MAEQTGIQWTNHTFNPVSGCTKISPGCANCYAVDLPPAMRRHAEWGNKPRIFASESYWAQLQTWHRKAKEAGVKRRVFCASVADIFEGEPGVREGKDGPRAGYLPMLDRLFGVIAATPWLEYQLLTKRPWNAARWWAESAMSGRQWPANALIGCTAENQEQANRRIPHLFRIPARRFVSFEPLLGPIDFAQVCPDQVIDWAIVGGESGRKARPMHPDWVRSLRDQCQSAGVAFFFKQMMVNGSMAELPELDGRVWQQFPGDP